MPRINSGIFRPPNKSNNAMIINTHSETPGIMAKYMRKDFTQMYKI